MLLEIAGILTAIGYAANEEFRGAVNDVIGGVLDFGADAADRQHKNGTLSDEEYDKYNEYYDKYNARHNRDGNR